MSARITRSKTRKAAAEPAATADKATVDDTPPLLFSDLPTELQLEVVTHLKPTKGLAHLVELQRLAASCKALDQLVSTAPIWRRLRFNKDSGPKMTDEGLRRLLTKINAHGCMESLKLHFCRHVRGHGLQPLQGALLLKDLDLRTGPWGVGQSQEGALIVDQLIGSLTQLTSFHAHVGFVRCVASLPKPNSLAFIPGNVCSLSRKHQGDAKKKKPAAAELKSCGFCTLSVCAHCIQKKRDELSVACGSCHRLACRTCSKLKMTVKCDHCGDKVCDLCTMETPAGDLVCPDCMASELDEEEFGYSDEDDGFDSDDPYDSEDPYDFWDDPA